MDKENLGHFCERCGNYWGNKLGTGADCFNPDSRHCSRLPEICPPCKPNRHYAPVEWEYAEDDFVRFVKSERKKAGV